MNQAKIEIERGTYVEPTQMTVGSYLMSWVNSGAVTRLAPKTASSYRQIVTQYVIPHIGQVPLQKFTAVALDDLYALLLESGGKRGDGRLSPRTVRLTHTIINNALNTAERKGLINRNIAKFADPPTAKSAKAPEPKTWTPSELRTFLDATTDHRFGALFHLAALTGLRRGELCGLSWESVDLDVGEVRVRKALILVDGVPEFGPPKSVQSRRTVNIDDETVAIMRRHRRAQKEARLLAGEEWEDTGLVFTGPLGQRIHPDNVSYDFKNAVVALDDAVPYMRFHGLRHTHTTHLLAAGVNPRVVSERLGHQRRLHPRRLRPRHARPTSRRREGSGGAAARRGVTARGRAGPTSGYQVDTPLILAADARRRRSFTNVSIQSRTSGSRSVVDASVNRLMAVSSVSNDPPISACAKPTSASAL